MKLRNTKEYFTADPTVSANRKFKSSKVKIKRAPKPASDKIKTIELRVRLQRINSQNLPLFHWLNYLKDTEQQDRQKARDFQLELQRRIEMTDHVKPVDALLLDGNMSENWRRFKRNYDIFASAARVDTQTDEIKINTFLNAIGPDAVDLYDTFTMTEQERQNYNAVVMAFETYCNPRKNVIYERYMFNQRNQHDGEKFDEFLNELRLLARYCDFGQGINQLLRDRIVTGIIDNRFRARLLEKANLTLEQCIEMARTSEATQQQVNVMNKTVTTAASVDVLQTQHTNKRNGVNAKKSHQSNSRNQNNGNDKRRTNGSSNTQNSSGTNTHTQQNSSNGNDKNNKKGNCTYCGYTHQPRKCPAYGKTCHKCNRKGHYKSMCVARTIACLSTTDSDDSENDVFNLHGLEVFDVNPIHAIDESKSWIEKIKIENLSVSFKVDTGAQIDVMPLYMIERLNRKLNEKIKVHTTNIKLKPYIGKCVNAYGECFLNCTYTNKSVTSRFAVVDNDQSPIIGLQSSRKLGIVPNPNKRNEKL